jgi:hypothetical protein
MNKRKLKVFGACVLIAAVSLAALLRFSGPQVFGTLPPEELATIRSVLDADTRSALQSARAAGGTTGLGEWVFERWDRRLLRLQSTNRVLDFYRTATPTEGRILVLSRGKDGWRISDTNNSVVIK